MLVARESGKIVDNIDLNIKYYQHYILPDLWSIRQFVSQALSFAMFESVRRMSMRLGRSN